MVVRVGSMATVSCKPKLLSIVLQYDCVCDVHLANVVLIQHPLQKSPPSGRTTLFPFFASAFLQAVGKAWWWYFLIAPPQHNDFGFLSHWILSYGHDLWIHSPSEANSTSRFAGSHTSLYIEGKKKRCKLQKHGRIRVCSKHDAALHLHKIIVHMLNLCVWAYLNSTLCWFCWYNLDTNKHICL